MLFLATAVALLAPLAAAVEFTSPAANSTLTKGKSYDLTWTTVDTDPLTMSIYLVNFVTWPPSYVPLVYDVEVAAGEAHVDVPCSTDTDYGFQFNGVNGTNTYVIYAQSPKFSVAGKACEDKKDPEPTCPGPVTVTQTVTVSANATTSIKPDVTSPGVVPKTIGWCSGYEHPVTLTSVPVAPYATPAAVTPAPNANTVVDAYGGTTVKVYSTVYASLKDAACYC